MTYPENLSPDDFVVLVRNDGGDWCHVRIREDHTSPYFTSGALIDQGHEEDVYERLIERYFNVQYVEDKLDRIKS